MNNVHPLAPEAESLPEGPEIAPRGADQPAEGTLRILIVEDDATSRKLLQALLSPCGHCNTAINGKEALEAFGLAWQEGQPYDLICLDIMMPKMDGQEVLGRIRRAEEGLGLADKDRVRVIMITALGDYQNVLKAATAGIETYLVKPIDKQRLLDEVRHLGLLGRDGP